MTVKTRNNTGAEALENEEAFDLWFLLQQTRDAIYNARNKELAVHGISQREAMIFHAIDMVGRQATPAELSRWVYRKPHTVGGILRRMQKKGYLTLSKDPYVKNVVRINLTAEGEKTYKASLKRDSIGEIFNGLTKTHRNQLQSVLTELRDKALQKTGDSIADALLKSE